MPVSQYAGPSKSQVQKGQVECRLTFNASNYEQDDNHQDSLYWSREDSQVQLTWIITEQ